jgi:integrase
VYSKQGTKFYWYWIKYVRFGADGIEEEDRIDESSKTTIKAEARQKLKERISELTQKPPDHKPELRINSLIDNYIVHYKHERGMNGAQPLPDWIKTVIKELRKHFGHIPAEKIKPLHIKHYINLKLGSYNPKKKKEIKAPGTIEKNLQYLNTVYNQAWKNNLVAVRALKVVRHRTRLRCNIREGFMEYHHFEDIYDNLPNPLKLPFKICYLYGLRKNECLQIEWKDLNLKKGAIRIPDTKTRVPRTIYVSEEIKKELQEHAEDNGHSRYVFTKSKNSSVPIYSNFLYKHFRIALERCGYKNRFIWHDTRRSAIRDMVRSGLPESVVMKISGHKSRSVFERYNITSEADLIIGAEMRQKYLKEQKDSQGWRVRLD